MDRPALRHLFDGRIESLAREIIGQFVDEIPAFGLLPRELLEGPILQIAEASVALVPVLLAEQRGPTPDEMAPFAASAAQRAQDGVPLDLIVRGYQVGVRRCWEETLALVVIDDPDDMRAITDVFFGLFREVNSVVATAHSDERTAVLGQQAEDRARLFARVLAGEGETGPDDTSGLRVPSAYVVLRLGLGPGPGEDASAGTAAATVAARTKLRMLHEAIHAFTGEAFLGKLDGTGGLVLVPDDAGDRGPALPGLVATLAEATGAAVVAASATAALPRVPGAVTLTGEILDVVGRFGMPPGHYTIDDVLLEYQWTRPSPATARMAALLDPLIERPALLGTVEDHLRNGLNRRRTAEALHVHPNTVDYRLRQVEKLLGLDFGHPLDVQRVAAALAARHAPSGSAHH